MAKSGFTKEDYASDPVDPFPDNVAAFELLKYMRTQWCQGPGGPYGLNYTVMHHKMDRMGLSPEDYEALEDDLRTMEVAALNATYKPL